jgi:GTP-sensing pleiotropic transcriptional regulator CodY
MKLNLDAMRSEIQEYLETHGLTVFYGFPRGGEQTGAVYWDTRQHPDYRDFLAAAQAAGVRLVTLHANEFNEELIEDAIERLEISALPREERRAIETRLREMAGYIGFTCQIELSFDVAPRVYIFDLHTEWFDDLNELLDRIDDAYEDHENEEPLGGGYFSKN